MAMIATTYQTANHDPTNILNATNLEQIKDHIKKARQQYQAVANPVSKVKDRFDKIVTTAKNLASEYERPAEITKLSVEVAFKALKSLFGDGVLSHPYIKYHETHLKFLYAAVKALGAGSRIRDNFRKALETSIDARNRALTGLTDHRTSGKAFEEYKNSFNPVFVGAALLRGMVDATVQDSRLIDKTIKEYMYVARASRVVHQRARDATEEIFKIYVALHQALGSVRGYVHLAEKDLKAMRSETGVTSGTMNNLATIAENVAAIESMANSDLDIDQLDKPLLEAIDECESVIQDWINADQKFTDDLHRLDVFAALRAR